MFNNVDNFIPVNVNKLFVTSKDITNNSYIIAVSNNDVILTKDNNFPTLDMFNYNLENLLEIGSLDNKICYGIFYKDFTEEFLSKVNNCVKKPIRSVFANTSNDIIMAISRAKELIFWRKQHIFCGSCKSNLIPSENDLGLVCPNCKMIYFPQIAPAVITAITRNNGKEILLAHNVRFSNNIFSLIAGFIETGENAESAVKREIKEEIGINVKNIEYISSQPWPFPNTLMLAFHAEYESGIAIADGVELSECNWFTKDNLPEIPLPGSIARKVIDSFIEGKFVK